MMLASIAQILPPLPQVSPFFITEERERYAILYELQTQKTINTAHQPATKPVPNVQVSNKSNKNEWQEKWDDFTFFTLSPYN